MIKRPTRCPALTYPSFTIKEYMKDPFSEHNKNDSAYADAKDDSTISISPFSHFLMNFNKQNYLLI